MTVGFLAVALLSLGVDAPSPQLYSPRFVLDHNWVGPTRSYEPEPGDIMLATDGSLFWLIMHNLALTSHPTHSGILFRRSDGTMAILEGGPHDTLYCRTMDALPHLDSYAAEGRVWVRRRANPLTKEQSAELTAWAEAQDGKLFAIQRLGWQLCPLRTRGLFTRFVGKPSGNARQTFFCSELVVESCVAAGLIDARTARPSATYPRDLFFDSSINPYINKTLKLAPDWDPPARYEGVGQVEKSPPKGIIKGDFNLFGNAKSPNQKSAK